MPDISPIEFLDQSLASIPTGGAEQPIDLSLPLSGSEQVEDQSSKDVTTQEEDAVEEVPVEEPEGQPLASNYRLKADSMEDKQVYALVKSGVPLSDAFKSVYGTPQAVTETAQQQAAEPAISEQLSGAEARLSEIRDTLTQMVEESGDVGLTLTKEVLALQNERDRLTLSIPRLEREVQAALSEEDASFNSQNDTAIQEAYNLWPDAKAEGTPLCAAIKGSIARMPENDPLRSLPDWPLLVAAREAARLGIAASTAKPAIDASKTATTTTQTKAAQAPQAQPRAFQVAAGQAGSSAARVTIATQTASPVDAYRETVATQGKGMLGILAGLDKAYAAAGSAAK